jgi:hypothetical protein
MKESENANGIKPPCATRHFQFSLSTALLAMTAAVVLLTASVLLPPEVIAFVAGSAIVFVILWLGELIRAQFAARRSLPIGSMMLTSLSVLIIILVLLPLPGGRGPVQYAAGHAGAMFVFNLRVATILVLTFSPLLCGLIGLVRMGLGMPARFGWLIAAIASYIVAWYIVGKQGFFPTV